jgi:hypothetical protein
MKKLLFTALIAVSIISSSFAASSPVLDKKVDAGISNSFRNQFRDANNVKWDQTSEFTRATFVTNNILTEAFFDRDGEFIGSSRAISLDQLPTAAKRTFAKKYAGYTVKEAIEFTGNEESAYFISAENETQAVILKVINSSIEVFKSTRKAK